MLAVRRFCLPGSILTLLLVGCDRTDSVGPRPPGPSALRTAGRPEVIPGRYIVVLRPGVSDVRGVGRRLADQHGAALRRVYTAALHGFTLGQVSAAAADALRHNPLVAYVEQDQVAHDNAAKQCKAEQAQDPAAFKQKYGTNKNKKNAFGKCVSQKEHASQNGGGGGTP